ncbi:3',5'-cyclic adenosine monophosphate phosphodiesterase CpdA [Kushneria pakistanensis]|uniref:3',5'-cyclic adenosine monophosphate phosphodiesterase CpdA n=1 Tax=Kushneria pakistanensis TaxID=1508770 RepID=A0ABQ3FNF1_9GAMM|nr:metallophosphoesterase [Kushneria pakistanensis]GHC30446.1 3',5'-cyclic adenosine monophosphate phosphodiesterase CpdA [Kushneria pakistanensis]
MLLIQLSDSHLKADPAGLYRDVDVQARLSAMLASVSRHQPDLVVFSGDVSDDGSIASYQRVAKQLDALGCPWVWLPGNHDHPATMADVRPLKTVIHLDGWQIILLDSWIDGEEGGRLGEEQLARLETQLADDASPALIVLHHPPVTVDAAWMNEIGLEDRETFWARLDRYDHVHAVLCGHIHHEMTCLHDNVPVMSVPAIAAQFVPDSPDFAVDSHAPGGFRLVRLSIDEAQRPRLSTRVEYLLSKV